MKFKNLTVALEWFRRQSDTSVQEANGRNVIDEEEVSKREENSRKNSKNEAPLVFTEATNNNDQKLSILQNDIIQSSPDLYSDSNIMSYEPSVKENESALGFQHGRDDVLVQQKNLELKKNEEVKYKLSLLKEEFENYIKDVKTINSSNAEVKQFKLNDSQFLRRKLKTVILY